MKTEYEIKAMWDPDAGVWVASSEEVPGLCTEAETLEILIEKLKTIVRELLQVNGVVFPPHQLSFHIVSERTEMVEV
jgi:predicted RNase H-like HicB family nuclease